MVEVTTFKSITSWSHTEQISEAGREQFDGLVNGRHMIYAPVPNPKSFCTEMKPSSGRLMDFNKGMFYIGNQSPHSQEQRHLDLFSKEVSLLRSILALRWGPI